MVGKWPTARIEQIAEKVGMGPFGSSIKVETFVSSGVPVISGQHLRDSKVDDSVGFNFISTEHAERLKSANVQRGDVVLTHAGNIGQVAYIPATSFYDRYVLSQRQFYLRCDRNKVMPEFVVAFFKTNEGRHKLLANTSQTGVPSIAQPVSYLRTIEIPLPPLSEQRAIVAILSSLDDRIDINRKVSERLEAIARALFKSWFVDFDPVRARARGEQSGLPPETAALFPDTFESSPIGLVPHGWAVRAIADICTIAVGGDWGADQPSPGAVEAVCLRGTDLEALKALGNASPPRRWVSAGSVEKRSLQATDVIVAGSGAGPTGRSLWAAPELGTVFDLPVGYSNFCKRLTCSSASHALYLDAVLSEMRRSGEIWNFVNGTSVPNLDASGLLKGKWIVLPPQSILDRYFAIAKATESHRYLGESRTLATLRDLLLPKLVSGEVRIGGTESVVEATA